jgi:hypothetical protein
VGLRTGRPNCGLEIVFVIRVTARQLAAHDYFVVHGYAAKGASAIIGNSVGESGQDLDSTFDRQHADHESGGFLEWRDSPGSPRKTRLAAFADARGPGLRDDLFTQCDYAIWELGKFFPILDQQLRTGTRSIATLTANFCWQFENPAPATAGLDNRITHAEAVAARAAEIWKASHEPQPSPPAPLPQPPLPQPQPAIPPTPTAPAGPPISASSAGRRAAVRDNIGALRDALVQERDAIDAEIGLLDTTLTDFGKLEAMIAPAALPKPVVDPNLIPQTQRTMMNPQINAQILATLRSTLLFLGGVAVNKGLIDQSTLVSLVGMAVSAISYGWSVWGHSKTNIIAAAAALPEVQKIIAPPSISDSAKFAANPKVVSH